MGVDIGHILASLGWTMLHAVWQGGIAAIIVVGLRGLTKNNQSALRYSVEFIVLLGLFVTVLLTFVLSLSANTNGNMPAVSGQALLAGLTQNFAAITTGFDASVTQAPKTLSAFFAPLAPVLGLLWCLGFCVMGMRYGGAFWMSQKLRRQGLSLVSREWSNRFEGLVAQSGITRRVRLFVSDYVNGPLTLGFFKPLVLVPAGFLTNLSPEQVDAILLHELAHIRRHDYLVNLLQTVIKTVLFFHPAVHYICRKMDEDREHACDDFAVARTHNPVALAKGLAALRLDLAQNPFALAADNGQTPLVARLKRLANMNETRRRPEHVLTSVLALMVSCGLYMGASSSVDAGTPVLAEAPHLLPMPVAAAKPAIVPAPMAKPVPVTAPQRIEQTVKVDTVKADQPVSPILAGDPLKPVTPSLPSGIHINGKHKVDLSERLVEDIEHLNERLEADLETVDDQIDDAKDRFEESAERLHDLNVSDAVRSKVMAETRATFKRDMKRAHKKRAQSMKQFESDLSRLIERHKKNSDLKSDKSKRKAQYASAAADAQLQKRQKYGALRDKILAQLSRDGLISTPQDMAKITYQDGAMVVNGRLLSYHQEKNYCDMMHAWGGHKNDRTIVKLSPSLIHFETQNNDGDRQELTIRSDAPKTFGAVMTLQKMEDI